MVIKAVAIMDVSSVDRKSPKKRLLNQLGPVAMYLDHYLPGQDQAFPPLS
jgi:hypothetical protein